MTAGRFERRQAIEFRADGGAVSGIALRYGEVASDRAESFQAGAFGQLPDIRLNLQHTRQTVSGPVMWQDGPDALRFHAGELAEGARALVKRGALRGASIEFRATSETVQNGVRMIERAELAGLALVDMPSYPGSTVEARAKSGRRLRSSIPYDRAMACECIAQAGPGSGGTCVPMVKFAALVGQEMAELVRQASTGAGNDVLAVYKDYSRPLGSARKGTLRAVDGPDGLAVEVDLPAGEAGDMAVAAAETAGVIVRPLIDYDSDQTRYTDTPEGRVVHKAAVKAFLIGSTDSRAGWDDAAIDYSPDEARASRRRRVWL